MKKYTLYLFFLMFPVLPIFSQNFSGKIVNIQNQPILGSNVFITNTNQGLICNEKGEFQTTLQKGIYNIEYRCLGYKPHREIISVKDTIINRNIVLEQQIFELKEIVISNKEDPAYPIIREAIKKAPYYLNAAKKYTADVYIKANMGLNSVSKTIDRIASVDGLKMSDMKGQVFIQESFNEINFTAPDKYEQKVKAFSSTLPDNFDPKESFGLMTGSIYAPLYNHNISPLNPDAFSYYKYKYEGFSEENNMIINKIKFEAKFKDPILINGYLYIADNTWHIHYAELSRDIFGMKQDFIISYQTIEDDLHLPTAYTLSSDINTLGVKGYFNYYSSIEYKDIQPNNDRNNTAKIKKEKRSFEIKKDTLYTVTTDSLATKRDSSYWTKIRTLPLGEKELKSYIQKDSFQNKIDSLRKKYNTSKISISDIIFGGRIGSDTAKFYVDYDGLWLGVADYNFVDGFWLGQKIHFHSKLNKHNKLTVSPYIYHTWSRKKILFGTDIHLKYAPLKLGELNIQGASISEDFNPDGITRFDNFIASAISRSGKSFFYQKDYIHLKNKIDIINGLTLSTEFEIAKRYGLTNHTDWGIWGDPNKIRPNIYSEDRFDATSYSVALSYAPHSYYSINDGLKKYEKITSPTFTIIYKEGFSSWQKNNSKYRSLTGGIEQNIKLDHFSRIDYNVSGGSFIGNTNKVHFVDYHHFNTSNMFSISKNPYGTFVLLDSYAASTKKYWLEGKINYENRFLLLKRISFLQSIPLTENIHFKYLYTPYYKSYTEIGYSLDLIRFFNLGIHASFIKGKYENFGIRLCYSIKDILKKL